MEKSGKKEREKRRVDGGDMAKAYDKVEQSCLYG